MSPELARLRALAARTALDDHDYVFYGSAVMLPPTDKGGHVLNFTTCPHPDCRLVREPLAASSSPAWEPSIQHGSVSCDGGTNRLVPNGQDSGRLLWQPIETAPKDGTDILAWRLDWERPMFVNWRVGRSGLALWNDAVEHDGEMSDDPHISDYPPPTHWIPLPPAPKEPT